MPVAGLPVALELSLTSMLEENILSSWKVTGGSLFGTVTLHFKMVNNHGPITHTNTSQSTVSYRKKPPSHVNRDQKRMKTHKGDIDVAGNFSNENKLEIDKSDKSEASVTQISDKSMESDETDKQQTHVLMEPELEAPCQVDISETNTTASTSGEQNKQDDKINGSPAITIPLTTLDNEQTQFKCDVCYKGLTKTWIRCTQCGYFNMCHECYRQAEHFSHLTQTREFSHPMENTEYCDSCGQGFRTRNATYYQCVTCENYTLCKRCKADNMHRTHSFIIKTKT